MGICPAVLRNRELGQAAEAGPGLVVQSMIKAPNQDCQSDLMNSDSNKSRPLMVLEQEAKISGL